MPNATPPNDQLAEPPDWAGETLVAAAGIESTSVLPAAGYRLGAVIGRGGMGEVVAARDQRIGREVAVKRMIGTRCGDEDVARFLREARIQARLDHPAIVPVYELGTDEAGRPFFSMKRLAGITLTERLAEPDAPLQPLLRAFVDVCLAIDLAHARSVVHRDLKPSNIMLGGYGEVYVLDWGIARVLDEAHAGDDAGTTPQHIDIATFDGHTRPGALLGTPGYMAPELLHGDAAQPPADVYALGAILFEILSGEQLHPRGTAAIAHTVSAPQCAPSTRRPDRAIPPELDQLCFHGLAANPRQRPSARQLADRVQAYLDGDRDLERRRTLAASELDAARAALALGDPEARVRAIRHAGRALALDPESEAVALIGSLVLEPPAQLPAALAANLEAERRAASSLRTRRGVYGYLSVLAFWAVVPFLHVRSWRWLIAFNVVLLALAGFGWIAARRGRLTVAYAMLGNLVLGVLVTRIAGPFLLTPLVICGVMIAFSAEAWTIARPRVLLAWVVATVMTPFALEWAGVLEQTWFVDPDGFVARSAIYELPGAVAGVALVVANLVFICIVGLYALEINRIAQAAQRALHIQAWHLRQLLPPG